jgi:hypothetical protein
MLTIPSATIPSTAMQSAGLAIAFALATLLTAGSSELAAKPGGPSGPSFKPSFAPKQLTRVPLGHRRDAFTRGAFERGAFRRGAFDRNAFGPGWWGGGYWIDPALTGDDAGVDPFYPAAWTMPAEPLPVGVNCQKTLQTFTVRAEGGGTREVRVTRC